jgi:hypothetical protein
VCTHTHMDCRERVHLSVPFSSRLCQRASRSVTRASRTEEAILEYPRGFTGLGLFRHELLGYWIRIGLYSVLNHQK